MAANKKRSARTDTKEEQDPDQKKQRTAQKCLTCGTNTTCRWRNGPHGNRTLCNTCGLKWLKTKSEPPPTKPKSTSSSSSSPPIMMSSSTAIYPVQITKFRTTDSNFCVTFKQGVSVAVVKNSLDIFTEKHGDLYQSLTGNSMATDTSSYIFVDDKQQCCLKMKELEYLFLHTVGFMNYVTPKCFKARDGKNFKTLHLWPAVLRLYVMKPNNIEMDKLYLYAFLYSTLSWVCYAARVPFRPDNILLPNDVLFSTYDHLHEVLFILYDYYEQRDFDYFNFLEYGEGLKVVASIIMFAKVSRIHAEVFKTCYAILMTIDYYGSPILAQTNHAKLFAVVKTVVSDIDKEISYFDKEDYIDVVDLELRYLGLLSLTTKEFVAIVINFSCDQLLLSREHSRRVLLGLCYVFPEFEVAPQMAYSNQQSSTIYQKKVCYSDLCVRTVKLPLLKRVDYCPKLKPIYLLLQFLDRCISRADKRSVPIYYETPCARVDLIFRDKVSMPIYYDQLHKTALDFENSFFLYFQLV